MLPHPSHACRLLPGSTNRQFPRTCPYRVQTARAWPTPPVPTNYVHRSEPRCHQRTPRPPPDTPTPVHPPYQEVPHEDRHFVLSRSCERHCVAAPYSLALVASPRPLHHVRCAGEPE